jgi:hypothetical protein
MGKSNLPLRANQRSLLTLEEGLRVFVFRRLPEDEKITSLCLCGGHLF